MLYIYIKICEYISLMGTSNMEAKYEGEYLEEESGWTSYLQTDVSLFSETSSTYSNCSTSKILNGIQNDNIGDDNYRLATITTYNSENDEHKIVGGDGNIEEGGKLYCNIIREETDFNPDEEEESSNYNCVRASSTTLSDASFTSCFNSPIIISKESFIKPFYPKLHQIIHPKLLKSSNHDHVNQYKLRIRHAAANCLEDTATSSAPASSAVLLHAIEDSASSSSTAPLIKVANVNERQEICYEESTDAVSTRFKALEALIPRLKQVQAGKGKEEEMVKVIERHVRHLELKVELLSSAWQLSQLKHQ